MSKGVLRDREFNSSDEIEGVITKVWDELTFDEVQIVFHNWMSGLAWVIENGGKYIVEYRCAKKCVNTRKNCHRCAHLSEVFLILFISLIITPDDDGSSCIEPMWKEIDLPNSNTVRPLICIKTLPVTFGFAPKCRTQRAVDAVMTHVKQR
jgi:hypothetical protein